MINEIMARANLHKKRLQLALKKIELWKRLDISIFEGFEKVKTVDTFLCRLTRYNGRKII